MFYVCMCECDQAKVPYVFLDGRFYGFFTEPVCHFLAYQCVHMGFYHFPVFAKWWPNFINKATPLLFFLMVIVSQSGCHKYHNIELKYFTHFCYLIAVVYVHVFLGDGGHYLMLFPCRFCVLSV